MHVYSEVGPIDFSGSFSQINAHSMAAFNHFNKYFLREKVELTVETTSLLCSSNNISQAFDTSQRADMVWLE